MAYKHAYLNTFLLLHSTFMLSVVKMSLKGEVGGHAIDSHGNYIVEHGKSWNNHGIVFLNFCGNLAIHIAPHLVLLIFSSSDFVYSWTSIFILNIRHSWIRAQ